MGEWIKIIDELPAYGEVVDLAINKVVQDVTFFMDGADDTCDWFEPYGFNEPEHGVMVNGENEIHWKKRPEPPKE